MTDLPPIEETAPPLGGARDLTQGPVARTLAVFALPALIVNILQSANGVIGSIFVGKMLGEAALAATATVNMIMFVVFATVFGFAMAGTILVGHAMGRKDIDEARRITGASVGLFAISGVLLAVTGWITTPAILHALATPEIVVAPANFYMRMVCLGLPLAFINMLLPSLLRGIGDSISPLRATILNLGLCVALCPLLIPAMGIGGAALAAIIANAASVLYQLVHVYRQDIPLRLRGHELRLLIPDWGHARPLLALGLPMGLSMIVMGVSQLGLIALINREGMETVAAFGAVNQLWGFLQMPAVAVGSAASAMAAQNIGAGRWHRINAIAWSGMGMNLAMSGAMLLAITLFQRSLLGLFLPAASPAIAIGAHINTLLGWTHVMMGISTIVTSIVRANGAMIWPLINLFCTAILLRFAVGYMAYPYWGAEAIWAALGVPVVIATLWSLGYYRWGKWREKGIG